MTVRVGEIEPSQLPRERLARLGAPVLSDQELLAIVIGSGRPGESVIELAAGLLAEAGGLAALAGARPEELARRPGVGRAKAAAIVASLELGRRSHSRAPARQMNGLDDLARVAVTELAAARKERAIAIAVGSGRRLLAVVPVSEGSATRTMMPVREVLNAVLRLDGVAFAVAHSHPSGDPAPSFEDGRASARMQDAAKVVGLRFLGHLIVAGERWALADPDPR